MVKMVIFSKNLGKNPEKVSLLTLVSTLTLTVPDWIKHRLQLFSYDFTYQIAVKISVIAMNSEQSAFGIFFVPSVFEIFAVVLLQKKAACQENEDGG